MKRKATRKQRKQVRKRAATLILTVIMIIPTAIHTHSSILADEGAAVYPALTTHSFDDETAASGIIDMNAASNHSVFTKDEDRGNVISLGQGSVNERINGVIVNNPFASVNTTQAIIDAHYNEAMSKEKGIVYDLDGPAAEVTDFSTFDSVKAAIKDVGEATPLKDSSGSYVKTADGQTAKVSAYNPDKQYPVPIWKPEDGVSINVWAKVPETASEDSVLFEFYNENYILRSGVETYAASFVNTTGHFKFTTSGNLEFEELSMGAVGQDNEGNFKYASGLEGSRNLFEAKGIGTAEKMTPLDKKGEWVCVTLVCENDYVSVYYNGIPISYKEARITSYEVGENGFVQSKDPVTDYNWTRQDMATYVQAFNGYFGSRNTPAFLKVNKGIYKKFPKYEDYTNNFAKNYAFKRQLRISLVDWLKDKDTVLYLGGAAQKDLSRWVYGTSYTYHNDYTAAEDTRLDDMSFYDKALSAEEVKTIYEAAKDKPEEIPSEPPVSETPTDTPVTEAPTDAPVTETPTDTPVTEMPSDTPVSETPTDAPVSETPTDAPVSETPTDAPVSETPTDAPVSETPTDAPVSETPTEKPQMLYGDVNGDKEITATDALNVLMKVVRLKDLTVAQTILADVDNDNTITANDALWILKKVVRLVDKFPIEK